MLLSCAHPSVIASDTRCCTPYTLFFFKLINLFLAVLGLHAARGLSLVVVSGAYPSLRCADFSLRWLLLLWSTGSRQAGLSSCGAGAQLLCGMWDLPVPGIKPMTPALAGGFLTTAPSGKSLLTLLNSSRAETMSTLFISVTQCGCPEESSERIRRFWDKNLLMECTNEHQGG